MYSLHLYFRFPEKYWIYYTTRLLSLFAWQLYRYIFTPSTGHRISLYSFVFTLHIYTAGLNKNYFRGTKKKKEKKCIQTAVSFKTPSTIYSFFFSWQYGCNFCHSRQLAPAVVGLSIPTRLLYAHNHITLL